MNTNVADEITIKTGNELGEKIFSSQTSNNLTLSQISNKPLYPPLNPNPNFFSYQTIAQDLEVFIASLNTLPLYQAFVANGGYLPANFLEQLNKDLNTLATNYVNNPLSSTYNGILPTYGWGRRIILVSNDGSVLLDTSYSEPSDLSLGNVGSVSIVESSTLQGSNAIPNQNYANISATAFPIDIFNISIPVKVVTTQRPFYGQPTNPVSPALYKQLALHTTRNEVLTSSLQTYGLARRQSSTTGNIAYYVCKRIDYPDNYTFFARLSYESIPLPP